MRNSPFLVLVPLPLWSRSVRRSTTFVNRRHDFYQRQRLHGQRRRTACRSDRDQRRTHRLCRLERVRRKNIRSQHAHASISRARRSCPVLPTRIITSSRLASVRSNSNLESATSRESFLTKVKEQAAKGGPGPLDHRPRLDRNFLEAASVSNARGPRQSRAEQPGLPRPGRWSWRRRKQQGAGSLLVSMRRRPILSEEKFSRDKKTGEATGMLLDNAMELVEKKIPPPTPEENEKSSLAWSATHASLSAGAKFKMPAAICQRSS